MTDDTPGQDSDIVQRLLVSEGVTSLRAEQHIVASFSRQSWWTVDHGPFYRDRETKKLRELDVRATRQWLRPEIDAPTLVLDVLVEHKTMKGHYVVFAPRSRGTGSQRPQLAWTGHSSDRLRERCRSAGLPDDMVANVVDLFTSIAFPEGVALYRAVSPDPPVCSTVATAFRETNVGSTKELESSVLWKAVLSLSSVMESARDRAEHLLSSDILGLIDSARSDDDFQEQLRRTLEGRLRVLTVMHPVVVTDAHLWLSTERALERVPHVRFAPQMPEPSAEPWFDIVHSAAFDSWAGALTEHYRAALEHPSEAGIRRSAESLSAAWDAFMLVTGDPSLDMDITVRDRSSKTTVKRIKIRAERVQSS